MRLKGMERVGAGAVCDMMLGVLQCGRGRQRACIMFTQGVKILKRSVEADEDEDGNRRAGAGAGAGAGGAVHWLRLDDGGGMVLYERLGIASG